MTRLSSPQKTALNDQQPLFVHSLFSGIRYRGVCCWTILFSRSVQHPFVKLDQPSDRMLVTRPQVILLKLSTTTRSYIGRLTSTCSDLGLLKIMADMRIKPIIEKFRGTSTYEAYRGWFPPCPRATPGTPAKTAPLTQTSRGVRPDEQEQQKCLTISNLRRAEAEVLHQIYSRSRAILEAGPLETWQCH